MSDISRIQPVNPTASVKRQRKAGATTEARSKATRAERVHASSRDQLVRGFRSLGVDIDAQEAEKAESLGTRLKQRLQTREHRRQNNLESILNLALDYAPAKVNNDELDIDWLNSFMQQAEDISNPAMQKLWARILASESSKPGSFSLKTLKTLKQLTSREADILRRAQAISCRDSRHISNKIITGYYRKPSLLNLLTLNAPVNLNLARAGLSYPDVLTLCDLGVLYPAAIESGELELTAPLQLSLGNDTLLLTPKSKGLVLTYHKYTAQGEELLRLLPTKSQQAYIEMLQEHFSRDFSFSFEKA